MKKIILPVAAFAVLSLASCQKERTCTCTTTQTTNGNGSTSTDETMVGHVTKKEAKRVTNCYSYTQTETNTVLGTVYTTDTKVECKLK